MSPVRARTLFYPKGKSDHDRNALPTPKGQKKSPLARMNKGEMRYAAHLDEMKAAGLIAAWWYEFLSIRLADDTTYKPDFLVMRANGALELHEVKGASRGDFVVTDTAWVKSKMTADIAPFPVRIVWPDKQGGWQERVL